MKKSIFISYAHKDVKAVSRIVKIIEDRVDCSLWFDKKLQGGDEYFSIIADRILSCEYFLFMVSPHSVTSNWCIHELEFAMSEQRKIIAIWMEDFSPPPRVRLVISNTHYIRNYELTEDDLADTISAALNATHLDLSRGESEYKISEQEAESGKYFVSPEEKKKITRLLESEKKQDMLTCFQPENAVLLGLAYEMGVVAEKSETKAALYYHIAAYKGSTDGEYLKLALALSNGTADRTATVRRMNELAEAGCIKAMVYWGDELYKGNYGMTVDKPTAYRWFRRAADAGDPVAKYFLGFGHRVGEVEDQPDYTIAWMYFHEAAQQHFPRAYRQIGLMYSRGQLVEKDLETARQYFHKAIDCGDVLAHNYLGNLEYNEKNYEASVEHYSLAADHVREKQLPNGQPFYNLGWSYEHGQGVAKDGEKAVELYLEGAVLKHGSCRNRLPICIYHEIPEYPRKVELLKRAAELDCPNAEHYLGFTMECALSKEYVQTPEIKAVYESGADKGCLCCMEELMVYYSWVFGHREFADREKSLQNYSLYFSLLDLPANAKHLEQRKDSYQLQQYYYGYAVELDVDLINHKPDTELAMYYYKKCLECENNHKHWPKVANIALAFAMGNTDLGKKNVEHAEELAELCYQYFGTVCEKLKTEDPMEAYEAGKRLLNCYETLLRCYSYSEWSLTAPREKVLQLQSRIDHIKRTLR